MDQNMLKKPRQPADKITEVNMISLPVVLALMLLCFACGAVMSAGFHVIQRDERAKHSARQTRRSTLRGVRIPRLAETDEPDYGDAPPAWKAFCFDRLDRKTTAVLSAIQFDDDDKSL
jgi:hypothetical protein